MFDSFMTRPTLAEEVRDLVVRRRLTRRLEDLLALLRETRFLPTREDLRATVPYRLERRATAILTTCIYYIENKIIANG